MTKFMKSQLLAVAFAVLVALPSQADDGAGGAKILLDRHNAAFAAGDLDAMLAECLLCLLPYATSDAHDLIVWPDPEIMVPPVVQKYILGECNRYLGTTEESLAQCIDGEEYGYRAVVGMLSDPLTGETSGERYRACAAGLGDFGGRFHRRKAECIGSNLNYVWRFEFSLRT